MITERQKLLKKFENLSLKHHKLSLLMFELGQSINLEIKKRGIEHSRKKIKEYLKTLNLDFDKVIKLSNTTADIKYEDLKKDG